MVPRPNYTSSSHLFNITGLHRRTRSYTFPFINLNYLAPFVTHQRERNTHARDRASPTPLARALNARSGINAARCLCQHARSRACGNARARVHASSSSSSTSSRQSPPSRASRCIHSGLSNLRQEAIVFFSGKLSWWRQWPRWERVARLCVGNADGALAETNRSFRKGGLRTEARAVVRLLL